MSRKSAMSESSTIWDRVVQHFVRPDTTAAAYEEFLRPDVDRVGLLRRALRLPGGNNRATAVALLEKLTVEEKKSLFPELIQLARSAHGPVGKVRDILLSLPREWVLSRIDGEVEPILREEEYDDYWMFLELYKQLDTERAVALARRAALNGGPDIRELGLEKLADLSRELLSVNEVASRLSVAPRTVWRWVAQGRLPRPLRLRPGCVRWWSSDVEHFLEALVGRGDAGA
jgi:predicted DNA-binding transcriptional regulator AlpA